MPAYAQLVDSTDLDSDDTILVVVRKDAAFSDFIGGVVQVFRDIAEHTPMGSQLTEMRFAAPDNVRAYDWPPRDADDSGLVPALDEAGDVGCGYWTEITEADALALEAHAIVGPVECLEIRIEGDLKPAVMALSDSSDAVYTCSLMEALAASVVGDKP